MLVPIYTLRGQEHANMADSPGLDVRVSDLAERRLALFALVFVHEDGKPLHTKTFPGWQRLYRSRLVRASAMPGGSDCTGQRTYISNGTRPKDQPVRSEETLVERHRRYGREADGR